MLQRPVGAPRFRPGNRWYARRGPAPQGLNCCPRLSPVFQRHCFTGGNSSIATPHSFLRFVGRRLPNRAEESWHHHTNANTGRPRTRNEALEGRVGLLDGYMLRRVRMRPGIRHFAEISDERSKGLGCRGHPILTEWPMLARHGSSRSKFFLTQSANSARRTPTR